MKSTRRNLIFFFWICVLAFLTVACGPSGETTSATNGSEVAAPELPVIVTSDPVDAADAAYPGAATIDQPDSPYPGPQPSPEGMQSEPPARDIPLPEAEGETGVVGGILIREVVGEGFIPLLPQELYLGEIITTDSGHPAYVRTKGDSPSAKILPTGIFTFSAIPPGVYGLVVDLGFTQFLITQPDGEALTFSVEAGKALDLGQVITQIPD